MGEAIPAKRELTVSRKNSISVVIPTRNRSSLLRRAIQSCLDQGPYCGEVVIVDDHSTDNTFDVVLDFRDSRVRYLKSESEGAPAARNHGVRACTSELIKFLDDDDYFLRDSFRAQVEYFEQLSDHSRDRTVVYGDWATAESELDSTPQFCLAPTKRRKETEVCLLLRSDILTSSPLHQRKLLLSIGGFDESLRRGQEHDLHLRLALAGSMFEYCTGAIYVYDRSESRARISNSLRGEEKVFDLFERVNGREKKIRSVYGGNLPRCVRRILAAHFSWCEWEAKRLGLFDLRQTSLAKSIALDPRGIVIAKMSRTLFVRRCKKALRILRQNTKLFFGRKYISATLRSASAEISG